MADDRIEFTATGRYFKVYCNGEYVSQHTAEREASQKAANILLADGSATVSYVHEYSVKATCTWTGAHNEVATPPPGEVSLGPGYVVAPEAGKLVAESKIIVVGRVPPTPGPEDSAPTVISTPAPVFVVGTAAEYEMVQHVVDDGRSPVSYVMTGTRSPTLFLDVDTGKLIYNGGDDATTSTSHVLLVHDSAGLSTSAAFTIEFQTPPTATVTIDTIPNISFAVGGSHLLTPYINDPEGLRTNTEVTGLVGFATYDAETERLTGAIEGTETGLELVVHHDGVPADPGPGPEPNEITYIILVDESTGADRPITFGLPIAESELVSGDDLTVTKADGSVVSSQWNELATWRTDGSVLHGAMTILTPDSGDNSGAYLIKTGANAAGDDITTADIAASSFDAEVSVVVDGDTYSLSAADLLNGTVTPTTNYTHFSGPLCTEIMLGGKLRLNGTSTENTLGAVFYIRAYNNPVTKAYVGIAFENTGAWTATSEQSLTSVDLTIGGASLSGFPKTSFTAYPDFRYIDRGWWNGSDSLFVQHDLSYVSDTKLMPKYRDITMAESALASFPQSSTWNQRVAISKVDLDAAAAKPELAPYDRFAAAYMVSGDKRAWNAMRALYDEYGQLREKFGAKSAVRSRDETTGLPLNLATTQAVSLVTGLVAGSESYILEALGHGTTIVAKTDIAHWPSHNYLTYLLSAETSELECVQMSGISVWINEGPGGDTSGATLPSREFRSANSQTRGMAWGFREIVNAAVVTPDHHPLRVALQMAPGVAIDEFALNGEPNDPSGTLGLFLYGSYKVVYDATGTNTGVSAWQNDWLIWSIGSAYERGWSAELDASGVWDWIAQGAVGRMGTSAVSGYCWVNAPWYSLTVRDSEGSAFYTSWAKVYDNTVGTGTACAAPGTAYMVGSVAYADTLPDSYAAQLGGALSMTASTNVTGGVAAWDIYDSRLYDWDYTEMPEWGFTKR